jgi:hypothetical protein
MVLNLLLKKVPVGIQIPIHPWIRKSHNTEAYIKDFVKFIWCVWLVLYPASKFPITFGKPYIESYVIPDFGTGKFYTSMRTKPWSIDYI